MSRSNKTDSDLLTGLLREAITKRQSGLGRTFYLLSADYIALIYLEEKINFELSVVCLYTWIIHLRGLLHES